MDKPPRPKYRTTSHYIDADTAQILAKKDWLQNFQLVKTIRLDNTTDQKTNTITRHYVHVGRNKQQLSLF